MPFYEYECAACGHELEAMQKFSDPPLRKCPNCGKNRLKKLMSAPSFRLAGGGWYETDFKGDKDNKRNLAGETDKGEKPIDTPADTPADKPVEKTVDKPADKPAEKTGEKAAEKAPEKPPQRAPEKAREKAGKKPEKKVARKKARR